MKAQWAVYSQFMLLAVASFACTLGIGHYVLGRYSLDVPRCTVSAPPPATAAGKPHDLPSSSQSEIPPAAMPVSAVDPAQNALVEAWSYLAKRQYDPQTHDRLSR